MVGGLIEEEEIRPEEEEAREGGAHAPASRELGERPMRILGGEAQPTQDDLGLRLQAVATERLEAVLDLAITFGSRLASRMADHEGSEAPTHRSGEDTPQLPSLRRLGRRR